MKKTIALILVILVFFTYSVSALEYGSEWNGYTGRNSVSFSDVSDDHWAKENINRAVSKGWFEGYPDGTFHPDASISRAEAMTVFVKFLGLQLKNVDESTYYDVKTTDWYSPYIEAGKELFPVIPAYNGNTPFRPEMPITREDTVYALVTALKYNDKVVNADQSVLNMFSDKNSISEIVKPYMAVAVKNKIVSGYPDGRIGAQDPLTRAEFATLLYRGSTIGFGTGTGIETGESESAVTPTPTPQNPEPSADPEPAPSQEPQQNEPVILSGIVKGKVVDENNQAIEGATVTIGDSSAVTDSNGLYTFTVTDSQVTIIASKEGYVGAQTTMSVTFDTTNYAENLKLVPEIHNGIITGKVYDASVQNGIVAGAVINFRANGNTRTGEILATTTSGSDGSYSVTLPTGTYTAEGIKNGYSKAYVTVVSQENEAQQNITLAPARVGTVFVLTWGEQPLDIDSHLTGPLDNGSRFHVYFSNMRAYDNGSEVANLDRDDVNSYGPETVTLKVQKNGTYRYTVHDYTNRNSTNSNKLSLSGAKVTVYVNGEYRETFNVPVNVPGTIWTVFELNGNTITPINSMDYKTSPSGIGGTSSSTLNDAILISEEEEK